MHLPAPFLLAPIAVMATAVVHPESAQHGIDLVGIASLTSAGVGVVGLMAAVFKHKKTDQRVNEVQQAASYIEGFDALVGRLQEEIDDLREAHNVEHKKWMQERSELQFTIEKLKNDLTRAIANGQELRGQLAELRGQIKGFLNQQQYEEFQKHLRP